jgi:hypothetical protein
MHHIIPDGAIAMYQIDGLLITVQSVEVLKNLDKMRRTCYLCGFIACQCIEAA